MNSKPGLLQVIRNSLWNPRHDAPVSNIEERSGQLNFQNWKQFAEWYNVSNKDSYTGQDIKPDEGSRLDTYFACINTIAQDIAATPSPVKQTLNGIRTPILREPVHYILNHRANKLMTSYVCKYVLTWNVLTWGNAYAYIERDNNMNPVGLLPLVPSEVEIDYTDGRIYYYWNGYLLEDYEVVHFKLFTLDGIKGISPISYNAHLAGYKIKQDKYSSRAIAAKPPGFISGPQTSETLKTVAANWAKHMTKEEPTGVPYLPGELKFNPLMITPNEAQNLETKEYTDMKIAGIFRVPLSKIQNKKNSKYNTAEQEDIDYVKGALMPIYEMMKQELDFKLFPTTNFNSETPREVIFNIWHQVRADLNTRTEFTRMMRTSGLANADELRQYYDLPPLADELGQDVYIQGAMMPLAAQRQAQTNNSPNVNDGNNE